MKKYTDSQLARIFIETRENKHSFWKYLRAYLVKYLCFLVPASVVFWLVKIDLPFFTLLFGLFVGALARDIAWLIYGKKTWPFHEKVIDWQKVEQLADTNADTK